MSIEVDFSQKDVAFKTPLVKGDEYEFKIVNCLEGKTSNGNDRFVMDFKAVDIDAYSLSQTFVVFGRGITRIAELLKSIGKDISSSRQVSSEEFVGASVLATVDTRTYQDKEYLNLTKFKKINNTKEKEEEVPF